MPWFSLKTDFLCLEKERFKSTTEIFRPLQVPGPENKTRKCSFLFFLPVFSLPIDCMGV